MIILLKIYCIHALHALHVKWSSAILLQCFIKREIVRAVAPGLDNSVAKMSCKLVQN